MKAEIRIFGHKQFIGMKKQMSYLQNKTFELWSTFMPRRKEIKNVIGQDLFSIQNYPEGFYNNFDFSRNFEKWACLEVSQTNEIPSGMELFHIPTGKYAVFIFKGSHEQAPEFFKNIFYQWLPSTEFELDLRPHFEILGSKYEKDSPHSEEEVWIPIKDK